MCTRSNALSGAVLIARGLDFEHRRPLLWSFEGARATLTSRPALDNLGGHSGGDTPLPIPNREVKPASADGTRGASPRESRTPPIFSQSGSPLARASRRARQRTLARQFRIVAASPTTLLARR